MAFNSQRRPLSASISVPDLTCAACTDASLSRGARRWARPAAWGGGQAVSGAGQRCLLGGGAGCVSHMSGEGDASGACKKRKWYVDCV